MSLEVNILIGAITFLFGALSTLARLAWMERGKRCEMYENDRNFYRDEILPLIRNAIEAADKSDNSLQQLTRVVEKTIEEMSRGGKSNG